MDFAAGFRRHIEACNRHDLSQFIPFVIDGKQLGWIKPALAELLTTSANGFRRPGSSLVLSPALNNFASRSRALVKATAALAQHFNRKLRNELYPVIENWGDEPLAQIDRVAVPWFGLKGFGIHVNGFVHKPDGIHLWIGERAADRLVDPGKLDNMIGGGQPIGLTLIENLKKEAWEEAGVTADLAATALPAGSISYTCERPEGLRRDTLFTYDLELPTDFTPHNTDGEVARFHLLPLTEVAQLVATTDRFKFNCNLVIVDFLQRHGWQSSND